MPANRNTPWLICYDIANERRLRRVHRIAVRYAIPYQYSIFFKNAPRSKIVELLDKLEGAIDPRHDDVRAYPLLTSTPHRRYGRGHLPDGVIIVDDQPGFINN